MKLPDVYSDWKIMTGLVLIALGAGNWLMGIRKTSEYTHSVSMALESHSEPAYRSFEELDANKNQAALEPLIAAQRQVSYATARMDFYHVTAITGRVLFATGLMITLGAFLAAIRRDTRRAIERARDAPSPDPSERATDS